MSTANSKTVSWFGAALEPVVLGIFDGTMNVASHGQIVIRHTLPSGKHDPKYTASKSKSIAERRRRPVGRPSVRPEGY